MKIFKHITTTLLRITIILLSAFGWSTQSYALKFMALETIENNLYRIDTENIGAPEFLGVIGSGSGPVLSELVNAGPNRLYTLDRVANSLWTISYDDLTNPVVILLDRGVSTYPRGYDISPAGALYGVFGNQLFNITPTTGTTTYIADITGAFGVEAIAFAPDGTLYAVGSPSKFSSDTLYTLNIATGQLSLIGTILVNGRPVPDIDTLAYATDGYLYGADSVSNVPADLIRIDPATAAATVVGNTAVTGLNGLTEYIEPARSVAIDIKPNSDTNTINLSSAGVIPVAILSTYDFDATTVDPATVSLAGAGVKLVGKSEKELCHYEDVNADGLDDLVCKVYTAKFMVEEGSTSAILEAYDLDGVKLRGEDSIRIVPDM